MNAAQIASALDCRREGSDWRCRCPVHGGRSLTITDGRDGSLLLYCFGGCQSREVFVALRSCGLIEGAAGVRPEDEKNFRRRKEASAKAEIERVARRIESARRLWSRGTDARGTPAEKYLQSRGLDVAIPPTLRWLPHCPHPDGGYFPALIARVDNISGDLIAVHRTFLQPDGSGKADFDERQRAALGPMRGGAVRLAHPRPGAELIVGEGIESTLSAMQLFGLPGWAAICAGGIKSLQLPRDITAVAIAADNDANCVGQVAARDAAWLWEQEGRSVRVALPPNPDSDFNDFLIRRI